MVGMRSSISRGSRCSSPSNPLSVLDSLSKRRRSASSSLCIRSRIGRLESVSFDSVAGFEIHSTMASIMVDKGGGEGWVGRIKTNLLYLLICFLFDWIFMCALIYKFAVLRWICFDCWLVLAFHSLLWITIFQIWNFIFSFCFSRFQGSAKCRRLVRRSRCGETGRWRLEKVLVSQQTVKQLNLTVLGKLKTNALL